MSGGETWPFNLASMNGVPLDPTVTLENLEELKNWRVNPDDVYIASYPKSGTTWTLHIVQLIKANGIDHGVLIPWLEQAGAEICKKIPSPRAFKSHSNYEMIPGPEPAKSPAKYIYVARNPKDTAVSFYHHTKGLKPFNFNGTWDFFFEQYMAGMVACGSWFDHVISWWEHQDADNILFLKYEDMKKDLPKAVETIASFIGYKLEPQVVDSIAEQCTFDAMQKTTEKNKIYHDMIDQFVKPGNSFQFFRKGTTGDWKNYFTEDQNRRFDEKYVKHMSLSGIGLKFEFE